MGGCGVTLAPRVSRKQNLLKYLLSITANIVPCQQGPGTALQCLQPGRCPPQRSASGNGQKGIVRGQLCFRSQLPGLGRGPTQSPGGWERREGTEGTEGTAAHGSARRGGTRPVGASRGTPMSLREGAAGDGAARPAGVPRGAGTAASCPVGPGQPGVGAGNQEMRWWHPPSSQPQSPLAQRCPSAPAGSPSGGCWPGTADRGQPERCCFGAEHPVPPMGMEPGCWEAAARPCPWSRASLSPARGDGALGEASPPHCLQPPKAPPAPPSRQGVASRGSAVIFCPIPSKNPPGSSIQHGDAAPGGRSSLPLLSWAFLGWPQIPRGFSRRDTGGF